MPVEIKAIGKLNARWLQVRTPQSTQLVTRAQFDAGLRVA